MAAFKRGEGDAPPCKKGRFDTKSDIFNRFESKFLTTKKDSMNKAIDNFKKELTALVVLEISQACNGADPDFGYCFTKAACTVKTKNKTFAFANFFMEGFRILKNYVTKQEIPGTGPTRQALAKLLAFLLDEDLQSKLERAVYCDNETELTVLLVYHLFSQLSLSPSFTIDDRKSCQTKICPCLHNHGVINYGDTSLGNPDVWHGYLDVIMEGADVIVETLNGERQSERAVDSAIEVKKYPFQLTDVTAGSSISQIIAQTIVYSFYQKKLHPEHENSLIPCIGVSNSGILFYFYDSVHDVLLGSTHFPLSTTSPFKLSITSIIAVWMVLNHKYLCNGLSLIARKDIPKANFLSIAEKKIDIYRNHIKRGDVGQCRASFISVDPMSMKDSDFYVSPEIELI